MELLLTQVCVKKKRKAGKKRQRIMWNCLRRTNLVLAKEINRYMTLPPTNSLFFFSFYSGNMLLVFFFRWSYQRVCREEKILASLKFEMIFEEGCCNLFFFFFNVRIMVKSIVNSAKQHTRCLLGLFAGSFYWTIVGDIIQERIIIFFFLLSSTKVSKFITLKLIRNLLISIVKFRFNLTEKTNSTSTSIIKFLNFESNLSKFYFFFSFPNEKNKKLFWF